MTKSEKFVLDLCKRAFLSIWSVPNPRGKDSSKELCDVLIVYDPDVIIISVKEVEYKPTQDVTTGLRRWTARAVLESVRQITGAERLLSRIQQVTHADGTPGLFLPSVERRRVHRVAVALGSMGEVPIAAGEAGKGFVHVFDEQGLEIVFQELDTITDFVGYLRAVEDFLDSEDQLVVATEEDLLGLFIHNGRSFPDHATTLFVSDGVWQELIKKPEWKARKRADRISYFWDFIIEHVVAEHDPDLSREEGVRDDPNPGAEQVVRILARENRFNRRMLAGAFVEAHKSGRVGSRTLMSESGIGYMFLFRGSKDREARRNELLARMFVARGLYVDATTVVGIATEPYMPGGFSFDVAALHKPEWTQQDQRRLEMIQEQTGVFTNPEETPHIGSEFPQA